MTVPQPYRRFPRLTSWLEDDDIKAKYGVDVVYRMHANETPLGPSPRAIEAMAATAAQLGTYPPMGDENVRARLAEVWGRVWRQTTSTWAAAVTRRWNWSRALT